MQPTTSPSTLTDACATRCKRALKEPPYPPPVGFGWSDLRGFAVAWRLKERRAIGQTSTDS